MDRVEATGRSVNEAIDNALMRLGASRDQVEIEVLHEGSRGILGIGAEDARVVVTVRGIGLEEPTVEPGGPIGAPDEDSGRPGRLSPERGAGRRPRARNSTVAGMPPAAETALPAPAPRPPSGMVTLPRRQMQTLEAELPEAGSSDDDVVDDEMAAAVASDELVETALGVVMELLELVRVDGEVDVRSRTYPLTLNIHGEDLGILIGRHGDTLGSLQFMVNLIVSRRMGRWTRVVVDVEEYRLRRERTLREVAGRAAERVRRTRQNVALEPMPANERRIVHMALQGDRYVSTHSIGEGDSRKVIISPRGR